MRRAAVFLGDLVDGLEKLRVRDPGVAKELARMLSLDRLEGTTATTLQGAYAPLAAGGSSRPVVLPPPALTLPAREQPAAESREATLRQIRTRGDATQPPAWLVAVQPTARPSGPTTPVLSPEPLFPPAQTRAVLSAALSTAAADGPLDLQRIVDMLARLEPIRQLPFESVLTMRRGVQVLIDTSPGMGPYRLDAEQLLDRIDAIVSEDQLRVYYFTGCPSRACAAPGAGQTTSWPSPPKGTPVFAITDLGIGVPTKTAERATVDEWLTFAERVDAAGSSLTALVPYGPRRWPRALARAMRLVHWDRRTTAAMLRRWASAERGPR